MQAKIMVVEDDPAIRQLLAAVLGAQGHVVIEVADGLSAHPTARDTRPDLVLCDVGLPGIDGFEVLGLLKDDPELADVPVIMVTAWAEPALVSRALDRGAADYVRKPFDIGELSARIDTALDERPEPDFLAGDAGLGEPGGLLESEVAAAARAGRPLSVVLMELDSLGTVEDALGAEAAGAVLGAGVRRMRRRARGADAFGRCDDDALMMIAAGTGLGGAGVLAEDLRALLAGRPLDTPAATVRMTASFGVAQLAGGEDGDALVARARTALREVQAGGGNGVRLDGAVDARVYA